MRSLLTLLLLVPALGWGQVLRGFRPVVAPSTISVSVTLTSAPSSVTVTPADVKYNKVGIFSFELDDNSRGMRDVYAMWHGGKAQDSTVYNGMGHTDGCGNLVKFRGALAVNGRGGYNNVNLFGQVNVTYSQAETINLVRNDWMIENHSFYHDVNQRYTCGYDAGACASKLHVLIKQMMKGAGITYEPRVLVCPAAWQGFARAADSLGYLAATSAGQRDGYSILPPSGQNLFDIKNVAAGYQFFGRWGNDGWQASDVTTLKNQWDNLVSNSSATSKKMWRLFSHGPQVAANFLDFSNYMVSSGGDKIWVASQQEISEYWEVKRLTKLRYSLSGNVLTITLDQLAVPAINRFRDMSLLIGGGSIQSISVQNADGFSYNADTGLLNIYKKKS